MIIGIWWIMGPNAWPESILNFADLQDLSFRSDQRILALAAISG